MQKNHCTEKFLNNKTYTKALLSAVPLPDPDLRKELVPLKGDVPSPVNPPSGCRFHPRRIHAMEICKKEEQILKGIREDHMVAVIFIMKKLKKDQEKVYLCLIKIK